jgi:hypothetical protein
MSMTRAVDINSQAVSPELIGILEPPKDFMLVSVPEYKDTSQIFRRYYGDVKTVLQSVWAL